jgi:hypothetical protein
LLTIALQHCRIFRTAHFSHHPRSKAINMSANCATWTSERIELRSVASMPAFMRQTAREIKSSQRRHRQITARAYHGKDVIGRQLEQRRAARLARPKTPGLGAKKSAPEHLRPA